jgi:hypothetical protein
MSFSNACLGSATWLRTDPSSAEIQKESDWTSDPFDVAQGRGERKSNHD